MKYSNYSLISIVSLVVGGLIGASALVALADSSWTPPSGPPTNSNVVAPLNSGPTSQDKAGPLRIYTDPGGTATYGLQVWGIAKFFEGLVIETRASDPVSPETGRIWLLTN